MLASGGRIELARRPVAIVVAIPRGRSPGGISYLLSGRRPVAVAVAIPRVEENVARRLELLSVALPCSVGPAALRSRTFSTCSAAPGTAPTSTVPIHGMIFIHLLNYVYVSCTEHGVLSLYVELLSGRRDAALNRTWSSIYYRGDVLFLFVDLVM
jgi:hypothetical protein